jgi:hypothetical protein
MFYSRDIDHPANVQALDSKRHKIESAPIHFTQQFLTAIIAPSDNLLDIKTGDKGGHMSEAVGVRFFYTM